MTTELSYQDFYEVCKLSGTVKLALRDDEGFAKWYKNQRKMRA
ncbi:MAG: hypothetical protein PHC63_06970 [Candidatus Bathyarchaeota archaeon]|nr:hypothetical protein [Candidatus Bathyarchaeota archaeon]